MITAVKKKKPGNVAELRRRLTSIFDFYDIKQQRLAQLLGRGGGRGRKERVLASWTGMTYEAKLEGVVIVEDQEEGKPRSGEGNTRRGTRTGGSREEEKREAPAAFSLPPPSSISNPPGHASSAEYTDLPSLTSFSSSGRFCRIQVRTQAGGGGGGASEKDSEAKAADTRDSRRLVEEKEYEEAGAEGGQEKRSWAGAGAGEGAGAGAGQGQGGQGAGAGAGAGAWGMGQEQGQGQEQVQPSPLWQLDAASPLYSRKQRSCA
eukprot:767189-Hanusia_phi.AAC.5